jgi:hypothetical protein
MRTYFRIMLLAFMAALTVGSINPVSANPCTIQSSPLAHMIPRYYDYNTNRVILLVSATCTFPGGQLSTVGNAIDASTNAPVGSATSVLYAAYGTNVYTGQLVFRLPPQVTGHTLQISISIYGGIYNSIYGYSNWSPLATSVETVQVNSTNYYNHYPYYNYPNCYYNNNCGYNSPTYNNQWQCRLPVYSNQVQCVGYISKNQNACVLLVIPVYGAIGVASYQYYTLQNLPSSYPSVGTWVFVVGQVNQGINSSSTGAECPGNYIVVSLITPA